MESNNISFKTQEKEIIINLQNRPLSNKNQNKLLHKNFILVELYGKGYENTHHIISRSEFQNIETHNNLSEYNLKSVVFTIVLPDQTKLKAVISQVQRQTIEDLNNKLTLIHLDFRIISDDLEIKKHPVTTYITNKENSQDYKNGSVLHLKRHIFYHKKAGESINSLPVKAYIDLSILSKANSISYYDQCIVSLTKR